MIPNIKTGETVTKLQSELQKGHIRKTGSRHSTGIILIIISLALEALFFWWLGWIFMPKIAILSFSGVWLTIYIVAQVLYFFTFLITFYLLTRRINWVDSSKISQLSKQQMPQIILFYPVLHESEDTMRTTIISLGEMDYPKDKYRIIAIPNSNDYVTIDFLTQLKRELPFLELLLVPPTGDPSWNVVWDQWQKNQKAYWWYLGKTKKVRVCLRKKQDSLSTLSTLWLIKLALIGY
jgi:cellulose synthase/poly-beta-1,6-N-acetylglucosamine synthase-like glycosyltransferase